MAPDAFAALVDQIRVNPEAFANAIEKLLVYTGGRDRISAADISAVIHKDKKRSHICVDQCSDGKGCLKSAHAFIEPVVRWVSSVTNFKNP